VARVQCNARQCKAGRRNAWQGRARQRNAGSVLIRQGAIRVSVKRDCIAGQCKAKQGITTHGKAGQGNETRAASWQQVAVRVSVTGFECETSQRSAAQCIASQRSSEHGIARQWIAAQRNAGCPFVRVGIPSLGDGIQVHRTARHSKAEQDITTKRGQRLGHLGRYPSSGDGIRKHRIAGQSRARQRTARYSKATRGVDR